MGLLTQGNVLQCHHLSETQNKTQKINSVTSWAVYQVSPGIHAAPNTCNNCGKVMPETRGMRNQLEDKGNQEQEARTLPHLYD